VGQAGRMIRQQLIALDELVEDELVADWHDLYASYLAWIDDLIGVIGTKDE
jgi:hypothetical protein